MDIGNFKNIDIYLFDQIVKGRFKKNMKILDAGCGGGRNSTYFLDNNYDYTGIDISLGALQEINNSNNNLILGQLEKLPFRNSHFDTVICNAVLHFAKSHNDFKKMLSEIFRVLNKKGILFIRTAVKNGIETLVKEKREGEYDLPDGTVRYLTDFNDFEKQILLLGGFFVEPMKSTIVHNMRSMGTFVIKKN